MITAETASNVATQAAQMWSAGTRHDLPIGRERFGPRVGILMT